MNISKNQKTAIIGAIWMILIIITLKSFFVWQDPSDARIDNPPPTDAPYMQLHSAVDQNPLTTNPIAVEFEIEAELSKVVHSTSVNASEFTVLERGLYFVTVRAQVGKTMGATKVNHNMFFQIDRGSGFVSEPNSNTSSTISFDSSTRTVVSFSYTLSLQVGDVVRLMQQVDNSIFGLGLKSFAAAGDVPATPSIIMSGFKLSDIEP